MKNIPIALIFSRLVLGTLVLIFSLLHVEYFKSIAVVLFAVGLLTDIFDGIVARKLKVSTEGLRRLDSTIDQAFFIMVAIAAFIECEQFFVNNRVELIVLASVEALTYLICFFKFKKEVATHSISSKIWTLVLFTTIIQIITTCNSTTLFQVCFYLGILTRLEIIGIILLLPKWTNDVPSIYQALLLRQGKPIKRHKLFNG